MVRDWIARAPLQPELERQVREAYAGLDTSGAASFAVRSSATAEDLPDASFAGQQETFLNIRGADNVLEAIKHVFASLYNDRAISYRVHKGYAHADVALSAGVQRMVRSDTGAAGVMFTMDTESGFREVVFITSSYGLGEMVVQGAVNPDEFYVSKKCLADGKPAILRRSLGGKAHQDGLHRGCLGRQVGPAGKRGAGRPRPLFADDADVEELAKYAMAIEKHYGRPMDIEWGKDGGDGKLYILQARPETVKSQEHRKETLTRYRLKARGEVLVSGRAIGSKIGQGKVARGEGRDGHRPRAGWRRAGDGHDRPELGAGDEARVGHRHQPRRAHLPCRDHRPRAGRAGRGRLRARDRSDQRGNGARPCPAPRATPASSTPASSATR